MKILWKYLKSYKIQLIIGPLFKLTEAILELFLPFFMAKIIDEGVLKGDLDYVLRTGMLMFFTATIGVLCALVCQYSASIVSQGFGTKLRNGLFSHISQFSNEELDLFGTASLTNRITNDTNQLQAAVAMLIRLVIRAPFLCIGGLVMAVSLDASLSKIVFFVFIIFVILLLFTMRKNIPLYKKVQEKLDNIALLARQNLSGVRVIRAFSTMKLEQDKLNESNAEYTKVATRVGILSGLLNPVTTLIMNLSLVAILWYGGVRVNNGAMKVGVVIAFLNYLTQILAALIIVSQLVVLYTKAFASAQRVIEVLSTKPSIVSGEKQVEWDNQYPYAIEFKDVSFVYEGGKEPAIEYASFQIKKGETVGIIGGTGSGKSTLVQLIPRFYEVTEGEVKVNGENVKEYDKESLIQSVSFVPQHSVLFSGTILENLKMGKLDATEEEVKKASQIAQAREFIEKMPKGYDSKIEQGGINFSGGQKQRLAIARALVKNGNILILDDSFHALDYLTDKKLRAALKKERKNMTTLIISQRASTIQEADQIIVLNEGAIVGVGPHDKLIDSCEVYREICESQMKKEA